MAVAANTYKKAANASVSRLPVNGTPKTVTAMAVSTPKLTMPATT